MGGSNGVVCDITSAEPTHWRTAINRFARIDRVFTNVPQAVLMSSWVDAKALTDPCRPLSPEKVLG